MSNLAIRYGSYAVQVDIPISLKSTVAKRAQRRLQLAVGTHVEPISHIDSHVVFFNNFFMSHKFLTELAERIIRARRIIRERQTGRCPLEPIKSIEKKPRGSYDSCLLVGR